MVIFEEELNRWQVFRKWQKSVRETPEKFAKSQQSITQQRLDYGLADELTLELDLNQQSRLSDWKEYHGFQLAVVKKWTDKYKKARGAEKTANSSETRPRWLIERQFDVAKQQLKCMTKVLKWIEQEIPKVAQEVADAANGILISSSTQSTQAIVSFMAVEL